MKGLADAWGSRARMSLKYAPPGTPLLQGSAWRLCDWIRHLNLVLFVGVFELRNLLEGLDILVVIQAERTFT